MRTIMKKLALAIAMIAALGSSVFTGTAQAAPGASSLGTAAIDLNAVEQVQYIYGGHNHCWYNRGWKGPGWYWCGYAWRRGYGWGGPRGWNSWTYSGWGPAPGVVVVAPGPYYWNGRHWHHRAWRGGRWYYY